MKQRQNTLKLNISTVIFSLSLIILLVGIGGGYVLVSRHQWNTIVSDAEASLSQTVIYVNTEINSYLDDSVTLTSNARFNQILRTKYPKSSEQRLSAASDIISFFSMLSPNQSDYTNTFVIYTENDTLYETKYVSSFELIPDINVPEQLSELSFSQVLWKSESDNPFVFYRDVHSSTAEKNILRVEIPTDRIYTYIDSPASKSFSFFLDEPNLGNGNYIFSSQLINGSELYALIPLQIQRKIFGYNLLFSLLIFAGMSILLYVVSKYLTLKITKNISAFVETLTHDEILCEPAKAEGIRIYDEFNPIKQKIINLLEAKHRLNLTLEQKNRNNQLLELQLLQAKFNPHLLYNTLSVIQWNVMSNTTENIADIITLLTKYYRHILNHSTVISIDEEFLFIEQYVSIMEFAHSQHYDVEFLADENVRQINIIKLTLQPLVENAILHGLNQKENGKIVISAEIKNNCLELAVRDNGYGMTREKLQEINSGNYTSVYKNYGVRNTRNLLNIYFGKENSGFSILSDIGKGTTAKIIISNYKNINN